jgi:hypothetical protein
MSRSRKPSRKSQARERRAAARQKINVETYRASLSRDAIRGRGHTRTPQGGGDQ